MNQLKSLKRKSIRDVVENPQADEYYVLVMRYYPKELRKRGMKLESSPIDVWDRDLAPSRQLLYDVIHGLIGWKEYKERFLKEVPKALIEHKLEIFRKSTDNKIIVFVCQESDIQYPRCHTWIILEALGVNCEKRNVK